MADVVVIGGGVIGLSVAAFAAESGAKVILLERDELGQACSYANAGLIVPSFSLPLAGPSTLRQLPQLLFGKHRMVGFRPRLDPGLYRWVLRFFQACSRDAMVATATQLGRFAKRSQEIFSHWSSREGLPGLRREGWLHMYETEAGLEGAKQEAALLEQLGMTVETLGPSQVRSLEREVKVPFAGGVLYPAESHAEPYAFCTWLAERARSHGTLLQEGVRVHGMESNGRRITGLDLSHGRVQADHYVVAAGSWSRQLVERYLGWLPVEAGKGYSITSLAPASVPHRPLMFGERHIVVTPFDDRLRLTTGMDLTGVVDGVDGGSIERLKQVGRHWLAPDAELEEWFGHRPMTPDGLPIVGATQRLPNLWLATGHGQLGLTLAPVTGQILAAQLAGEDPPLDPAAIAPARFGL